MAGMSLFQLRWRLRLQSEVKERLVGSLGIVEIIVLLALVAGVLVLARRVASGRR